MKNRKRIFLVFSIVTICFLVVSHVAYGCYWYLDKQTLPADLTDLILMPGQSKIVNYKITVMSSSEPIDGATPHGCGSNVYDTFGTESPVLLGTISYPADLNIAREFIDSHNIKFDTCGEYLVTNVANIGWGISDSWTINAHVRCSEGCTLTPGYWKTHSMYGPAPYDDAWALVSPDGEDTAFFLSGQSWYQVLWTPPANGNPYYILAHQYIAAYLNNLNGADTSVISEALSIASSLLSTHRPNSRFSKSLKNEFISTAYTLDQYNNGYSGPGHCSE